MPPRPQHTPSDLIHFMESDFITWMDRYHREHPGVYKPDETDESLMILAKKGIEHEKAFLASLQEQGLDVCVIARGTDAVEPEANTDAPSPGANPNPEATPDPQNPNPTPTPSEQTLTAMLSARAYIYQAAISDPHSHFHGVADFLVKVPSLNH